MKKVLLILLAVMTAAQMYAQKTLTGTITDGDTQEPIIGASVQVTGTSSGGVSDLDGHFSIVIPEGRKTVTISYVGYKSQTINIVGKSSINIMLQPSASDLDEVVVVGYGTMKRSDLTGSVASIDEKAIKEGVNTSLEQSMQGRIAGVQVMQNSGAPGGGISVQIRGISSLNGSEPLYVIDGIAQSGSSNGNSSALASINPS